MVLDVETDFGTDYNGVAYVPQNYDRRFHGPMRMRDALGNSYNVPAVEVMSWVGVDKVIRTAHSLGITSLDEGPNRYGLPLTLGRWRGEAPGHGLCIFSSRYHGSDARSTGAGIRAAAGIPHPGSGGDSPGGRQERADNLRVQRSHSSGRS